MESLIEQVVGCPYCGEAIDVLLDQEEVGHQYIEDCQVCCNPIIFNVSEDSAGKLSVSLRNENEGY